MYDYGMSKEDGIITQRIDPETAAEFGRFIKETGFPAGKSVDAALRLLMSLPANLQRRAVFPLGESGLDFEMAVREIIRQELTAQKT